MAALVRSLPRNGLTHLTERLRDRARANTN
jgi:hypothetical protein